MSKLNFWARLHDGKNACNMLRRCLRLTGQKAYNMEDGGGVYPNLFSTHPPFQLDGNMRATAGIAEMLLQSQTGLIELLPALPGAWPEGTVTGLKARNGVEVDMSWSKGKLTASRIKPRFPGTYRLKYGEEEKMITTEKPGEELVSKW